MCVPNEILFFFKVIIITNRKKKWNVEKNNKSIRVDNEITKLLSRNSERNQESFIAN